MSSTARRAGRALSIAPGAPAERLARLEADTRAALAGNPPPDMPFRALARVVAATAMPDRYPLDLIEGFRIDVEGRPFATFDDTLRYCYHVAGCVGVMMAIVMGVSPDDRATLDRASDLGIAFQLNNIARDVVEDAMNRRRYIPDDWLASVGLAPNSFAFPPNRRQLARLVARPGRPCRGLSGERRLGHAGAAGPRRLGGTVGDKNLRRYRPAGGRRRRGGAGGADRHQPCPKAGVGGRGPAARAQPETAVARSGSISRRTLDEALSRPVPRLSSSASRVRTGGAHRKP